MNMKMIKKLIVICMMLLTLCNIYPLHVNAAGSIITVTATGNASGVSVSGSVETDVLAVVIQVYKGEELVAMETTGVANDQTFDTRLTVSLSAGEYTVYVADFAGGAWTTDSFTIAATTTPPTTPPSTPNYGGGSSSGSNVVPTTPQASIPTDTIVKALKNQEEVTIKLTQSSSLPNTILNEIKGTNKSVTFEVVDENKEVVYSFTVEGSKLTDTKSFDMKISDTSANEETIKELTKKPHETIEFAHSGTLPGSILVKIKTEYLPTDKVSLVYFNETTQKLETIQEDVIIKDGYAYFYIDHCSTYLLVLNAELDLSAYTDGLLPVYENSRVTSIKPISNGFELNGYAFINGINCNKKNSLWREIIFVNEEDVSKEKAYRMQVTPVYNTFLNSNKNINPTGKLSYSFANYNVKVNPNSIKDYATNKTYQKMASGSYRVYIRVSDGKNSKLFPLKDIILSDGSTLSLPSGFEVMDETSRELRYIMK